MNKRLIPLLACVLLGWQLQAGEPMLVKEPEKPISLQRLPDGLWQADFGRDAFGQIELTLQSRSGGDTVFVHLGERLVDGRIWRKPTTTVRYRRIPARAVLFEGEGHGLSRGGKPKHRMRRIQEITEWMDRYLKA